MQTMNARNVIYDEAPIDLPTGLDLVVLPRRGAEPALDVLMRSLPGLAWRVARRLQRKGGK